MSVVLEACLPCESSFREKAIRQYVKAKTEKTTEAGHGGYKTVKRAHPGRKGTVRSHELEDCDEVEAKLGIPADQLGSCLEPHCGWTSLELPSRPAGDQATRDFEDCMRTAVELNAYNAQIRVTNATQLMYTRLESRSGRKPGTVNLLSKTNDRYQMIWHYEYRAFCLHCSRLNKSLAKQAQEHIPRLTEGSGWFVCPDATYDLSVKREQVTGSLKYPDDPDERNPAERKRRRVVVASPADMCTEALAEKNAQADAKLVRYHDAYAGHALEAARFVRDKSIAIGMELWYEHRPSQVNVSFVLPLKGIAELASYSAYWPASSETARFRLLSRPLQQGENGLQSIELKPSNDGNLVALVPTKQSSVGARSDGHGFNLPSTHDSLPADAPQLQQLLLPLSEGQLKTLRWALSREGRNSHGLSKSACVEEHAADESNTDAGGDSDFISTQIIDRRFGETDLVLQLRVERVYSDVRGGILAHTMGYGKTAIIIALMHCTATQLEGVANTHKHPRFNTSQEEDMGRRRPNFISKRSLLSAGTLVITPLNLFHQWLAEIKKFLGHENGGLRVLPIEDMSQLHRLRPEDVRSADVVVLAAPFFLSQDYQSHLSAAAKVDTGIHPALKYAALRSMVAQTAAAPVAGISKRTQQDPLEDLPVIFELFDWERVVFDEFHKCVGDSERKSASWRALHEIKARYRWGLTATPDITLPLRISEMAALLHVFVPPDNSVEAQRFLDIWVRADDWDTSSIPVTNHVISVHQTPTERALYLGQKQWLAADTNGEAMLLPFCSHFDPEALDNKGDASAAVQKVLDKHKLDRVEQQRRVTDAADKLAKSQGEDPVRLRNRLVEEERALARMSSAISFLSESMKYIAKLHDGEQHECSICMCDISADSLSVTKCGHVFCTDCIQGILTSGARECPQCRGDLDLRSVDPILSLQASTSVDCSGNSGKYGSKIARIILELRRIHSADATARVLVFVQWNELLLKMEAAMEDCGVHCVALRGGVAERQRTISAFADGTKRYVLLMAMEHDDSGLNLTCSNHVFFVHPMAAPAEVVRACERQALGRVRRRGQAKEVHLYRFVASGTVEETRAKEHHEVLFPAQ
eukprot:TRINITY_DN25641_c0_g1_i1.p1 TRINITY_DN25641_c0_g1~~TRINITY_DN25641_c0_g1_i1.p1  ORF type:complete len:1246 (-),score=214.50 TRINITY_DN25641_c0_g1_i1:61-3357(-)